MTPEINTESLAARFADSIEGLQEFFGNRDIRFGSPADIYLLVERLSVPGPFRNEMSSMLRAIIYREGGTIPRLELLEVIGLAIGGPQIDDAAEELHEPAGQLLAFVTEVSRSLRTTPSEIPVHEIAGEDNVVEAGFADPVEEPEIARGSTLTIDSESQMYTQPVPSSLPREYAEYAGDTDPPMEAPGGAHTPRSRLTRLSNDAEIVTEDSGAVVGVDQMYPQEASSSVAAFEGDMPVATPIAFAAAEVYTHVEAGPGSHAEEELPANLYPSTTVFSSVELPAPIPEEPLREDFGPPLDVRIFQPPTEEPEARLPHRRQGSALWSTVRYSYWLPVVCAILLALLAGLFLHHRVMVQKARVLNVNPTVPPMPAGPKLSPYSGPTNNMQASGATYPGQSAGPANTGVPAGRTARAGSPATPAAVVPEAATPPTNAPQSTTARSNPPSSLSPDLEAPAEDPAPSPGLAAPLPGERPDRESARPGHPTHAAPAHAPSHGSTRQGTFGVSSGVMSRNLVSAPPPQYPKLASLAHIEGDVVMQAVVSRNGAVIATHVLRGHHLLRRAAVDAVRRWRYRPYVIDGRPTDVATIVTVEFHLHH